MSPTPPELPTGTPLDTPTEVAIERQRRSRRKLAIVAAALSVGVVPTACDYPLASPPGRRPHRSPARTARRRGARRPHDRGRPGRQHRRRDRDRRAGGTRTRATRTRGRRPHPAHRTVHGADHARPTATAAPDRRPDSRDAAEQRARRARPGLRGQRAPSRTTGFQDRSPRCVEHRVRRGRRGGQEPVAADHRGAPAVEVGRSRSRSRSAPATWSATASSAPPRAATTWRARSSTTRACSAATSTPPAGCWTAPSEAPDSAGAGVLPGHPGQGRRRRAGHRDDPGAGPRRPPVPRSAPLGR